MDPTEAIVDQYLRSQGYRDVVYEPDGNVPPDFLIDGAIAIEVRRLNQHEETENGPRGLEHIEASVLAIVRDVLASFGSSLSGPSWFVAFDFRRPLPPWRHLKAALSSTLEDFDEASEDVSARIEVVPRFHVQLFRASRQMPHRFTLGGYSDHDRGGAVLAEVHRNLLICLEEKRRKVERVRNRYSRWWLVLVDRIGFGLHDVEQAQLKVLFSLEAPWEKVILVDPTNPEQGFSL